MNPVYQPALDSYLLSNHVERLVEDEILDMGTGVGIQAITAAKKEAVNRVVAVDINPLALEIAKRNAFEEGVYNKIEFVRSDLFQDIKGVFDWIIFNPPYLPPEGDLNDISWTGGEKLILRFLRDARKHMKPQASILIIYSSLTRLKKNSEYKWNILEERKIFYETLYCARLSQI